MIQGARKHLDSLAVAAGLCAVPLSIAVSETLLTIALVARVTALIRNRVTLDLPRVCWLWLIWAGLEVVSWLHSPQLSAGAGEMRHLLLLAAIFVILPALNRAGCKRAVWRGIFLTSTAGAIALIVTTVTRIVHYRPESIGGDAAFYVRNGGFLHHWMIYAVVELLIFGALLEFRLFYPEERKWATPALGIHCLAILFSLTRALWLGCFLIVGVHLLWRRSKWILVLPIVPVVAFQLAPYAVRSRVIDSSHADYYSNTERVQMWHVGWKMVREHSLLGVGPGRIEALYASYLPAQEAVPAYHGHLHNNCLQLAAQFGLPVLGAAVLWLAILLKDLLKAYRRARSREERFLCRSAFLGIGGFLIAGMTDYAYGHALGLILLSFVALSPLTGESPGISRQRSL
ncbi:MAG: O-antigen ligase family protein [Bryobacteraceae bacterium]